MLYFPENEQFFLNEWKQFLTFFQIEQKTKTKKLEENPKKELANIVNRPKSLHVEQEEGVWPFLRSTAMWISDLAPAFLICYLLYGGW